MRGVWVAVILFLTQVVARNSAAGGDKLEEELPAHKRQSVQYSTLVGPSFVNKSLNAFSHAPTGQTAHLTCIVRNLHNYTVSWVRARDIHLLTTGETTYTSDNRFVAVNPGGGERWMLRLHHAKASDAGTYLCQVSVSPPISTPVTLLVTEAVAKVEPAREVFLKEGSRVVLVCEVIGCPYPARPAWYRGRQLQDGTEVDEGRIAATPTSTTISNTSVASSPSTSSSPEPSTSIHSPSTSLNPPLSLMPIMTTSSTPQNPSGYLPSSESPSVGPISRPPKLVGLPIARSTLTRTKAAAAHSGVYTCKNTCTDPVNLTLHVLTGDEETAAMQHPNATWSFMLVSGSRFLQVLSSVTTIVWGRLMS